VIQPHVTTPDSTEGCFFYRYDARQRMIAKKVPSSGCTYMVYDPRGPCWSGFAIPTSKGILQFQKKLNETKMNRIRYFCITVILEIMNIIEKRDFIHNNLHRANENTINEFYEKLRQEAILATKLDSRAKKAENDILSGKVFSREEIEKRTANIGR